MWHYVYLMSAAIIGISFLALLCWNMTVQQQSAVHLETYTSCVHAHILKCISASKNNDPRIAWCMIREARACMDQLSKLTGGEAALSRMCGIDVTQTNNTMACQEQQILQHLNLNHPLQAQLQLPEKPVPKNNQNQS